MKRKLGDKVYYSDLFREFPSLRFLGDVPRSNIAHSCADSYNQAMRIMRIGPDPSSWIYWKEWIKIADDLGLRSSVPSAVIKRRERESALHGVANMISSAYTSPFPASINPCPRISFQRPKVRG
jgi:hypothetical protein